MTGAELLPPEPAAGCWGQAAGLPRKYGAYVTIVDPMVIEYPRLSGEWPAYVKLWPLAVCWGDWDLSGRRHPPFREEQIRQICLERRSHREVDGHADLVAQIRRSGKTQWKSLRSEDDIERYCHNLRALFEQIRTEGYRPRGDGRSDEITVRVGRQGGLLKCGKGTHRLAIARILRVPLVPVVVDMVHWEWAQVCVERSGDPMARAVPQGLRQMAEEMARARRPTLTG